MAILAAVAVAGAVAAPAPQEPDALRVELLRTWGGDSLTVVDGLANVPLAMLAGGTTGTYRFELSVFDADGNQLYRDSWERTLSDRAAAFVEAGTSDILESFRFGLKPGEYEVEVRAYPTDAPDLGSRVRTPVVAFGQTPLASDLFLASRVEFLDDTGGSGSWSITHGGFGIQAAARTSVLPREPRLFYYIELYDGAEAPRTVNVTAEVLDAGGNVLVRTPTSSVEVDTGGRPFTGTLSLDGLPPGDYRLAMDMKGEGTRLKREMPFTMKEPAAATVASGDSEEAQYFASLSDRELEDTFGGVSVLVTEAERRTFQALPPDAKRRYLTEFFQSHDPTPDAPGNQYLEDYLDRIGTIRARYGERVGTSERAPWATDMGKVYLRYGEPQDRIVNYDPGDVAAPSAGAGGSFGSEPPYEIWQYQSTGFVYLFIQENRMNVWRLVYTTDPGMPSLADWARRVGPKALNDLLVNYGIKPRI